MLTSFVDLDYSESNSNKYANYFTDYDFETETSMAPISYFLHITYKMTIRHTVAYMLT